MTYALLSGIVLVVIIALVLVIRRCTPVPARPGRRELLIPLAVVLALTAVFDNVIIGVGIVAYDPERISGIRLGIAPIEDFAYSIAAALVAPHLWAWLSARKDPR